MEAKLLEDVNINDLKESEHCEIKAMLNVVEC